MHCISRWLQQNHCSLKEPLGKMSLTPDQPSGAEKSGKLSNVTWNILHTGGGVVPT